MLLLFMLSLSPLVRAPAAVAGVPTRMPRDEIKGRTLYEDHCWQCHGPDGRGDGPLASAFEGRGLDLRGRPQDLWPELVEVVQQGRGDMPAFAEVMDRHDSRRILLWLSRLDGDELGQQLRPTRGQDVPGVEDAADDEATAGGGGRGDGPTRSEPSPAGDTPASPDVSKEPAG